MASWFRLPATKSGKSLAAGAIGATVISATALFVQPWEGFENRVRPDPIGIPTWCYGETEGPIPYGRTFSEAECRAMLVAKLPRYDAEMMRCVHVPLPDPAHIAFLSFSYNVGTGAFCKSTLAKRLNAGDLRAACEELLRWTKAGGKTLPGLVRRRAAERELCLRGVK